MTQDNFEVLAVERVKAIVDCISAKKYDELSAITLIEDSWCGDSGQQEEAVKNFAEWLDGQLELWAEDEGKEFVVDPFKRENLELDDLNEGFSCSTYSPASFGEELDFWFEIEFHLDDDDNLVSVLNVNI